MLPLWLGKLVQGMHALTPSTHTHLSEAGEYSLVPLDHIIHGITHGVCSWGPDQRVATYNPTRRHQLVVRVRNPAAQRGRREEARGH